MTGFEKIIEEAGASVPPFESWERLEGETPAGFAAFRVFRDYGPERSLRKAVDSVEKDEKARAKRYRVWRNRSAQFRWRERAAEYDRYTEKLKQIEFRKTIEAQGERHRKITGKMLEVVSKKLDTMNPEELTQGNVTGWVETAIRAEREAWQSDDCLGLASNGKAGPKQGELNFAPDFQGL